MLVIPAIDLKNGLCVRLLQGRKSEMTVYNENPVAVAKEFESAGAKMIHVVDLDGALATEILPNLQVVQDIIASVNVAIELGGGIRSVEDVKQLCDAGVARVVLGTLAAESPACLNEFVDRFSSKICVGIDAHDGRVMSRGWEASTSTSAVESRPISRCHRGVERIIYTDIARDGTLVGPNVEQTLAVVHAANINVTASGGVSSLDDIKRIRDLDESLLDSVIVGKALYEGKFNSRTRCVLRA